MFSDGTTKVVPFPKAFKHHRSFATGTKDGPPAVPEWDIPKSSGTQHSQHSAKQQQQKSLLTFRGIASENKGVILGCTIVRDSRKHGQLNLI